MIDTEDAIARLRAFQRDVRDALIRSRTQANLHEVSRGSAADTIYRLDTVVEPMLDAFCDEWAKTTPLVLIAEGVEGDGVEGIKVFPAGIREEDAQIRLIVDPIDGTRGLMYDKRSAWALAGVAPNKGPGTSLRDIEVAGGKGGAAGEKGFGGGGLGGEGEGGARGTGPLPSGGG